MPPCESYNQTNKKPKSKPKKAHGPRKGKPAKPSAELWRLSELPVHLQVELRDRVEQAKSGQGAHDFDEALADAERISDEMLSILSRRPAE